MFVQVVVNSGSGVGEAAENVAAREAEISAAFEAVGVLCEVSTVTGDGLEQAVRKAVGSEADAVVIAGGDGSLGTAASVLAESEACLGVLPTGTFNHFAKDLSIPIDLEAAAAVIADGNVQRVDIAELNGRCFVNNSSIGVYPIMVDLRDRIASERGWGKVRSVPVACWQVLRRFPARRITVTAGDYRSTLRTPMVLVGNNEYVVGPGGIGRRESISGGELCVYVARSASRLRLMRLAIATVLRGAHASADLDGHLGSTVTIEAGSHRLRVGVDGEVTTMRAPLRYRIRPAALTVLVPGRPVESRPTDA